MLDGFLKELVDNEEEVETKSIDLFDIKTLDECLQVSNMLKQEHAVIINLSSSDDETKQRVVDFISGALYITDGQLEKIAENIYLFSPKSLIISRA